jgi:autoinducer 2-degrading protein
VSPTPRVLIARYQAQPGRGDEVAAALTEMAGAVRRDEPACLLYRAARSLDQPDSFVLYEEYRDQRALEAHRETPHFKRLIEGTVVPLLVSREREVAVPVAEPDVPP